MYGGGEKYFYGVRMAEEAGITLIAAPNGRREDSISSKTNSIDGVGSTMEVEPADRTNLRRD